MPFTRKSIFHRYIRTCSCLRQRIAGRPELLPGLRKFPGFSGETIAYANPATGYVISNDGSERQIDACVRFLKYMLSKDVQEQIVTKTHQAPSNPNISDTWIHEQVPVLADAVQVCKQADLQILTLYSVLPAKTSAQLEQQLEELLRGKDVQRSVISIIADLEQERE